jgi:hypothetical protein
MRIQYAPFQHQDPTADCVLNFFLWCCAQGFSDVRIYREEYSTQVDGETCSRNVVLMWGSVPRFVPGGIDVSVSPSGTEECKVNGLLFARSVRTSPRDDEQIIHVSLLKDRPPLPHAANAQRSFPEKVVFLGGFSLDQMIDCQVRVLEYKNSPIFLSRLLGPPWRQPKINAANSWSNMRKDQPTHLISMR